ncbi:hypothetical protein PFISCL1PPCAC_6243, partial [Pristionchus fissidentatus]
IDRFSSRTVSRIMQSRAKETFRVSSSYSSGLIYSIFLHVVWTYEYFNFQPRSSSCNDQYPLFFLSSDPFKLELDFPLSVVSSPNKTDESLSAFFPIKT